MNKAVALYIVSPIIAGILFITSLCILSAIFYEPVGFNLLELGFGFLFGFIPTAIGNLVIYKVIKNEKDN